MLSAPFSSKEEDAEFSLGLRCRSQQALQVADENAGLVLGEVSTKREGIYDGALGVTLTGRKRGDPGLESVWQDYKPCLEPGPCLQGATVFWDIQSRGLVQAEAHQ